MSITLHCNKPRWIFLEEYSHTIFRTQHDTSTITPHSYSFLCEFLPFQFQPTFNTLLYCWHNIHFLTSQHLCKMYEHYLWVSIFTCVNINNFIFHYWNITGAINQDCCGFRGTDVTNTVVSFNLCNSLGKLLSLFIICVSFSNVDILFFFMSICSNHTKSVYDLPLNARPWQLMKRFHSFLYLVFKVAITFSAGDSPNGN